MPTAWTDTTRQITGKLEVQWDGIAWTDESARLISANGVMRSLPLWELAGGDPVQEPWTANFTMQNASNRYSPKNGSSPINAYIASNKGYGVPIRFSLGLWDGVSAYTYTRAFTGRIDRLEESSTKTKTVTFGCVDNAHKIIQSRHPTTLYVDTPLETFFEIVANDAGIEDVDMTLDSGLFSPPYMWTDHEQAWRELCWMAASEGGLVYFDQTGELIYENAESFLSNARHTVSQHTFDVSDSEDFAPQTRHQSTYNEVIVIGMPRAEYGSVKLYEIDSAIKIAPGQTETLDVRLNYPQASLPTPAAGVDYHVRDRAGNSMLGDVTVSLTKYAQRVEVSIVNSSTTDVAILHDFTLWGRPIVGRQTLQEKFQATDADIGDPTVDEQKTLVISRNPYIQLQTQVRMLGEMLMDRVKVSRYWYDVRRAQFIPDLIPMDLVTVVESGSGINDTGFIQSVAWNFSGGLATADYDIIDAGNWFPYSDYFILGTDTLGAGSTKKAWY